MYYQQKGDLANVERSLRFVYKEFAIQSKVNEIMNRDESELADQNQEEKDVVSYRDTCCHPMYAKATFVGIALSIFQQATGVNIVYFYSSQILGGDNMPLSGGASTFVIQGISVFGVFTGMLQTGYFGRKSIMFVYSLAMGAFLLGLGISL